MFHFQYDRYSLWTHRSISHTPIQQRNNRLDTKMETEQFIVAFHWKSTESGWSVKFRRRSLWRQSKLKYTKTKTSVWKFITFFNWKKTSHRQFRSSEWANDSHLVGFSIESNRIWIWFWFWKCERISWC